MISVLHLFALSSIALARQDIDPDTLRDIFGTFDKPTCVPQYRCKNTTTNDIDDEPRIDIRAGFEDNPCGSYLERLCDPEQIVEKRTQSATNNTIECGVRNEEGVGYRIIGDTNSESQFGEFPWMVALLESTDDKVPFCGGSLIHPQVVLTTAHCALKKPSMIVRAGEWDFASDIKIMPVQDRNVLTKRVHEAYNTRIHNNVALLFLDAAYKRAGNVNLACLPRPGVAYEHAKCIVNGWGKDVFEQDGKFQHILKKVELPLVERGLCEEEFRRTRLGPHFRLHGTFLCAGGEEGKDACTGDGGSPLVCLMEGSRGRYVQVGMVAWGIGCGVKDVPGAYTNLPLFVDWIEKQMEEKGFKLTA